MGMYAYIYANKQRNANTLGEGWPIHTLFFAFKFAFFSRRIRAVSTLLMVTATNRAVLPH